MVGRRAELDKGPIEAEDLLHLVALFFAMMASGGNFIVRREIWVALLILVCLYLLRWRVPISATRQYLYLWIMIVMVIVAVTQGTGGLLSTGSRLMTFVASLLLLEVYTQRSVDRVQQDMSIILRIMAIQAILTVIVANLFNNYFWTVNVSDQDYYTLGYIFNYHFVLDEVRRIRPDGFFYEPGVYQIYMSILLYLSLFWRFNLLWALIATVALIALWSTIGLLVTAILFVLAFKIIMARLRGAFRIMVIGGYVLLFSAVIYLGVSNYEEKTTGSLEGSSIARMYDYYTGLNIVAQHPFTGIGFNVDTYLAYSKAFASTLTDLPDNAVGTRPSTNGILQVFYTIGIPLGLSLLLGIFRQRLFSNRLAMITILIGGFAGQALVFTPFFLAILYTGLLKARRAQRITGVRAA
jgi:O-antigen ligase